MKKIILGLALTTLAAACAPMNHPATQQTTPAPTAQKPAPETAPAEQTAKPAGEGASHQP